MIKLILISCYNSHLVFKHFYPEKKIKYPEYKEQLAIELVGFTRNPCNNSGYKCKATHDGFQNIGGHEHEKIPEPSKTTFRYSSKFCKLCSNDIHLCVCNCFKDYHTEVDHWR